MLMCVSIMILENGFKDVGDVGGYLDAKEVLLGYVGITETQLVESDIPVLLEEDLHEEHQHVRLLLLGGAQDTLLSTISNLELGGE